MHFIHPHTVSDFSSLTVNFPSWLKNSEDISECPFGYSPPVLESQKKCNLPCLSDIQVSKKCKLQATVQANQAWEL